MPYKELNLDSQLCFRLYTASRLVVHCYQPFLEKVNLTYLQYIVMMVLWEKDRVSVGEISHRLMLESNTITPLLKRMEKEQLILREKGKKDMRKTIVSLTKKGKQLEKKAIEIPLCMSNSLLNKNISSQELLTMIPFLDKMILCLKNE